MLEECLDVVLEDILYISKLGANIVSFGAL